MKMHPLTPVVAIVCITIYGCACLAAGVNGLVTMLVLTGVSGLGGFGLKGVLSDKEKERLTEEIRRLAARVHSEDGEDNEEVKRGIAGD